MTASIFVFTIFIHCLFSQSNYNAYSCNPKQGICGYLQSDSTYGELFVYALRTLGILCVGLYRLRDVPGGVTATELTTKRYVITNPPDDFPLLSSDKASRYCLNYPWLCFLSHSTGWALNLRISLDT